MNMMRSARFFPVCLLSVFFFFCTGKALLAASASSESGTRSEGWCETKVDLSQISDWAVDKPYDAAISKDSGAVRFRLPQYVVQNNKNRTIIVKSQQLSSYRFESVESIAMKYKAGFKGRIRVILKDVNGNLFTSKRSFPGEYTRLIRFECPVESDSIQFTKKQSAVSGPFSIHSITFIQDRAGAAVDVDIEYLSLSGFCGKPHHVNHFIDKWLKETAGASSDPSVKIDLSISSEGTIYTVGDRVNVAYSISGLQKNSNYNMKISCNVFSSEGKELRSESIRDCVKCNRKIEVALDRVGLHAFLVEIRNDSGELLCREHIAALVWSPPGNAYADDRPYFFGMMEQDRFLDSIGADLDILRDAGVKVIRFPFRWAEIEKKQGAYDWKRYDFIMAELGKRGFVAQPMVFNTPDWAGRKNLSAKMMKVAAKKPFWIAPKSKDEFSKFMFSAARRYRNRDVVWEIWNEPNVWQHWIGGSVDYYIEVLNDVAETLSKSVPTVKINTAGHASIRSPQPDFFTRVAGEANPIVDPAIHSYNGPVEFEETLNFLGRSVGDRVDRVWVNESGFLVSPNNPCGEILRSAALVKTYALARHGGVKNLTWFIFRNYEKSTKSSLGNFSIVHSGNKLRPPILSYAATVSQIAGTKPGKAVVNDEYSIYEFLKDGKKVYVAWSNSMYRDYEINMDEIAGGASQFAVYNLFGTQVGPFDAHAISLTWLPVFMREN